MSITNAAAAILARHYGPEAVHTYSLPGVKGESVDVQWAGGLVNIHPIFGGMYRVNCALAHEDSTLLDLPAVVERMIATALANAN